MKPYNWQPLVSIIMPAHNSQDTIVESVTSVLTQTYEAWELLVIDDASDDGTLAITNKLAAQDPRIRVIALNQNKGVACARNVAIAHARGRYLAFLDSDDLWLPEKLKTQVAFMRERNVGFSFTSYRRVGVDGSMRNLIKAPRRVTYGDLLKDNVIGCLTVVIDRTVVQTVFMPQVKHEDLACWLSILKGGVDAYGVQQDLARYRVAQSSVSGRKQQSAVWRWRIYREVEELSVVRSAWYFAHYSVKAACKRLQP